MKIKRKVKYDYSKLRGKIIEVFGNQEKFSEAIGLSDRSVNHRMQNNRDWTQSDIEKVCEVLNIDREDVHLYFLVVKEVVEDTE